ncbi:MAG: histidinol-phosphate transaminase [Cyanobacteria bacterium P01_H01_bin.15]
MLKFLRSDLAHLKAYKPHPGGDSPQQLDRLDTNESPLDLPPALKQKLSEQWQNTLENNRYPDGSHIELKYAITDYIQSTTPGSVIGIDQISVGNGSDELIRAVLQTTCLGEGDIFVAPPTFSMYDIVAQTLGVTVHSVAREETSFQINLDQSQAVIEANNIRAVFMLNPNSPTGNGLSKAEIDWLRTLPDNVLVLIDEAYFEFSQQSLVSELAQHPNWLILRTFSKALRLAAHRVGYAIAHPELIEALEKVRLPYNLPSISQLAAQLCLQEKEQLLPLISEICHERDRLYQELQSLAPLKVWPSVANFLYCRLKQPTNKFEHNGVLVDALKDQGTLVRHTGGGIRISIGTRAENQRTLARLRSLLTTE